MTATASLDELLATVRSRGIRLTVAGDRLRCDAPRGSITPELRDALAAFKDEILLRLTRDAEPIPRRPRTDPLPLSPAQARLWLLDRLEGGTPRYNLLSALRLHGALDIAAVRRALTALAARHEILRTGFVEGHGGVVQLADDASRIEPILDDHPGLSAAAEAAAVDAAFRAESGVVFDLARPPLVRVRLLRFAAERHVLVLNLHHIIADVWSLDVLARDFARLYAGETGAAAAALAPLPVQYGDYAAWQQERVTGEALERGLAFWTRELAGLPEHLPLPTDAPRGAMLTYRGGAIPVRIPLPLVARLRELGRASGASLFMVLHAALCVLLARVAGSDDVAVGVPVTNRPRPELDDLVGFFINSLVLRARVAPERSFHDLLAQSRERTLAAFEHQDTPFEKLVEVLNVRRDLSQTPLFSVMLSFMNRSGEADDAGALQAEPLALPQPHALVELDWQLRETADGIVGFLIYAADLFEPATAERMAARFVALLERVCERPHLAVGALDVTAPGERARLAAWNDTTTAIADDRRVDQLVSDQAARTPDALALTFAGSSWSYARLEAEATRLAGALQRLGAAPGVRVGLCLERGPELVAALLAILKTGAAYVPLDPGFPPDRLAMMAADAGVVATIADTAVDSKLRARLAEAAPVALLAELAPAAFVAPALATADAPMYAIYTSGSTGRPKGVVVPHRAVANFLASMRREPGITAADALLAVTTLSFDIAVLELFLPLVAGARVVLASRNDAGDPHRLRELLASEAITIMQATPAMWRMLLAAGWTGTPDLTMLCGGEALPRELSAALAPRGRALWNMYGPTETTVWSAVRRVPAADAADRAAIETIGRPIANTRFAVVTPALVPVPLGSVGELCIAGDGVALGYLERSELTAERFVPEIDAPHTGARMYRTGDQARWRNDGTLEFRGRGDDQVKLRGFRIELGEIASALAEDPAIAEAVVMLPADGVPEPRLVAYYVPRVPGANLPSAELRERLRRTLPEYMVPAAFEPLDRLPLTPNGKVDRRALPAPRGADTPGPHERPNRLEAAVAGLWTELLGGGARPALDANFFDLGGHSLLIVRLHQRLSADHGATCSVLDLFRFPTVRQQAALVAGSAARRDVQGDAALHAKRQQQALQRQRSLAAGRGRR